MTPWAESGEGAHPGDCGYMIPGTWLGGGVTLKTVDCPQVQGMGRFHPGDCGCENPAAGLGSLVTLETVVVIPQYLVREAGSHWRMWTPRTESGDNCHPGDCGHVTQV